MGNKPSRALLVAALGIGGSLVMGVSGTSHAAAGSGSVAGKRPPTRNLLPRDVRTLLNRQRLFSGQSPYNKPIVASPQIHPLSDQLVSSLRDRVGAHGFVIATSAWSIPAFSATKDTPRSSVKLDAGWSPWRRIDSVPVPKNAFADSEGDGHLAIIDKRRNLVWEFWQMKKRGDGWHASWGTAVRLNGSGIHPHGISARGSGFSLLGGLIWPHEMAAGRIDHALVFSTDPTLRNTFVPPATESDGDGMIGNLLPEGARLQLDPSIDLGSLNLTRHERTIAKALQTYGMYLVDNGSRSIALYAVHPRSFRGTYHYPWKLNGGIAYLRNIPVSSLRVIDYSGSERRPDPGAMSVTIPSLYSGRRR